MKYNTKLNILRNNIIALVGETQLPAGMVYYMFKDLLSEMREAYEQSIMIESQIESIEQEANNVQEESKQQEEQNEEN